MSDDTESRVFYYQPAWQKWALSFVIMVGFTWYHLSLGWGSWAVEEPHGPADAFYLAMIVLAVGGLGALPAITLFRLAVYGHVTLAEDELRWRTWWDDRSLDWAEIRAVGEPHEESSWRWLRRFWFDRDRNIRLITEDGWIDIPCGLLPEAGDEAFEAIAEEGGFTEPLEHDGRTFRRRPDWSPEDLPQRHPWRRVWD